MGLSPSNYIRISARQKIIKDQQEMSQASRPNETVSIMAKYAHNNVPVGVL
jgi:hypothetical protein